MTSLLRAHLHPSAECASLRRASVGNSQETWFVEAVWPGGARSLVLRRSAAFGTLPWTDRAVEYTALRVVRAAGLPVPPVVWLDETGGALERPYFVMDRVPGAPARRADDVSFDLGVLLARLHEVPVDDVLGPALPLEAAAPPLGAAPPAGTATPRFPGRGASDELARWYDRYRAVRLSAMPLLGALFGWLEAHAPDEVSPVLLWGDAGPHNLLVADGRITALLDWELAHLGHPLEDLGAAQWACFGVLDPEEILAGYESRAGAVDREALRWFRCLACVTRTVMLLASNRAWIEGTVHRPTLAALGLDLVARNLRQAAKEAKWEAAARGGGAAIGEGGGDAGGADAGHGTATRETDACGGADADGADGAGRAAALRPDAAEISAGLARFLAADLVPATEERALRRELKAAVALLETIALQTATSHTDEARLEDRARRLELAHDPSLRTRLLADLDRSDALLAPLRRLFIGRA